jgi:MFS family permease
VTVEIADSSGEQSSPKRLSPLSPFRQQNFSLLFTGQFVSVLGDAAYTLALPWTVLATTHDPGKMALVLAVETVTRTLSLMLGGALADRLSPRVIMLAADIGRAVVVGALAFTFFLGLPPLWLVAVLAGLQGVGSGLFMPGSIAMLPLTVSHDEIPSANGLMQMSAFLTMVIGPVLGSVATAAQAAAAFAADAGSFVVSALSLGLMRRMPKPEKTVATAGAAAKQRGGLLGEMRDGLRYALSQPLLRATMSVTVIGNLALSGVFAVALIVLSQRLDPSPVTLGLLTAGFGIGGIIGGISAGFVARLPRRATIALVTWAAMGVVLAAVPIVAGPAGGLPWQPITLDHQQRLYAVGGLLALAGLIMGLGDTVIIAVMQQKIPAEYMGRVFSLQLTAGSIAQPLSILVAGALAAVAGPGVVFVGGGVLIALAIAGAATSRELRAA